MPVATIYPASAGAYTQGVLQAGATKLAAAQADDGDSGYYYLAYNTGDRQSFYMDAIGGISSVSDVSMSSKIKAITGSVCSGYNMIDLGGTSGFGSLFTEGTSWTLKTSTALSRPGGGSWGAADFAASTFQAGDQEGGGGGGANANLAVTYVYASVTYILSAGGFAFLVNSWLTPLFGAGLLLSEMPKLARYIQKVSMQGVGRNIGECIEFARHRKNGSGTLILPSEYEVAYSEIKSCVNKSVFDIGGFSAKSV